MNCEVQTDRQQDKYIGPQHVSHKRCAVNLMCNITHTQHTHTHTHTHTRTHTHLTSLLSATTQVSQYQKGKTNLDFTGARDSEWQWHQLGRMQVCTSLQTDNHASTPPLSFLQARCPSCRPTNSVKALKAKTLKANRCAILHYFYLKK